MNDDNKDFIGEEKTSSPEQSIELFPKIEDPVAKVDDNSILITEETTPPEINLFSQEPVQLFPETKSEELATNTEINLSETIPSSEAEIKTLLKEEIQAQVEEEIQTPSLEEHQEENKNEEQQSKTQKIKKSKLIIISIIIVAVIALILFLTRPYIKLKGEKELTVTYNTQYEDAGYKKNKNKDIEVTVENNVDTTKLGEYKVIYKVTYKKEVVETHTRIVKVVDDKAPTINSSAEQAVLLFNPDIDETNYDTYVNLFKIEVKDNYDQEIDFEIDYSEFDKNQEGKHTIYVSSKDSHGNKAKKAFVIDYHKIHVNSLTLDTTSLTVYLTNTATIKAIIEPSDAYDNSVTWETSDRSIAKVENGVITPEKEGEVTICAKANDTLNQELEPQELKACATVSVSATPKQRFIHYLTTKKYYKEISNNVYRYTYGDGSLYGEREINLNKYTYSESSAYYMATSTTYNYKTNIMDYAMKLGRLWMTIKWNINTQRYSWQSSGLGESSAENNMKNLNDTYNEFNEMLKEAGVTREELISFK